MVTKFNCNLIHQTFNIYVQIANTYFRSKKKAGKLSNFNFTLNAEIQWKMEGSIDWVNLRASTYIFIL